VEDREAIEILKRLMGKKTLTIQEKEAVLTAIGVLSWSALGQTQIKNIARVQKKKQIKSLKVTAAESNNSRFRLY